MPRQPDGETDPIILNSNRESLPFRPVNQGKEDIPDGVAKRIPHQATHIEMKEGPPLNPGGQLEKAQSEIQITVNALATNGPDKVVLRRLRGGGSHDTGATIAL